MALSAEQFGKAVVASGLMSADELRSLWSELPAAERPKDGESFSSVLLKRERLNEFQARELLSGSNTPLVFGDYVLLGKIGAGGMGQVFKAHHRRMDRYAAIKLLPASLTKDEASVKRFEREVKAAAKLSHPNIVQTFDAGVQRGVHYLVMEYVAGRDLSAIVKERGPLPVAEAVDCIVQAARGLAFAHSKGVVHRDIKPANLLLDGEGVVKILDMGLARFDTSADAADHQLTNTGAVMGTVDYMAPEQAQDTHAADSRSDIYSLGCSLFRLLTGDNVFHGDTVVKKILAHMNEPIPSLSAKRPDAPAEIDRIFQKMVAKKPTDRYRQTSELVADLEAYCRPGVTTSFASPAEADSKLSDFLRSVNQPTGTQRAVKSPPQTAPEKTISSGDLEIETDPKSEIAIPAPLASRGKGAGGEGSRRGNKPPAKLIAAGLGGLALLVAFGIWVIVRDKDGNETARIKVPAGGNVQVLAPGDRTSGPYAGGIATATPPAYATSSLSPGAKTPVGLQPPPAVAPFDAAGAKAHQAAWAEHLGIEVETVNSVGQKMVLIPPGEFLMGISDADIALALKIAKETKLEPGGVNRIQEERPQHRVRITQPFRLAAHEVTIGQFAKFIEQAKYKTQSEEFGGDSDSVKPEEVKPENLKLTWRTPGQAVTDDSPVTQVSWNDAVAFCNWLSVQEQLTPCYQHDADTWTLLPKANGYRLPTEAEWEYACRAGTKTQFWFGDNWKDHDKYGWSKSNAGNRPQAVGSLPANPFGLYDMHGNVWEWCHDWYDGKWYEQSPSDDPLGPSMASLRVYRGGSWYGSPARSRSSSRLTYGQPWSRISDRGFRPALSSVGAQSSTASVAPSTPPVVIPPPAVAPFDAKTARSHQDAWAKHLGIEVETPNSVGQKLVLIPPGEFLMGSTDEQVAAALKIADEVGAEPLTKDRFQQNERPQHKVVITKPFLLSATEVTVGQFKQFAAAAGYQTEAEKAAQGAKTSTYLAAASDDLPAAVISWNDAAAYCEWLTKQETQADGSAVGEPTTSRRPGLKYRLPTEAEWEYACRAGTTTQYSFGDDYNELAKYGWYIKNSGDRSHPVGTLLPNPFGLLDMHGNLHEWCGDYHNEKWYSESTPNDPNGPSAGHGRVLRGGTRGHNAFYGRSATRYSNMPSYGSSAVGFRVVCELSTPATTASVTPPPAVPAPAPSDTK